MPSCAGADSIAPNLYTTPLVGTSTRAKRATAAGARGAGPTPGCWKEQFCDEELHGRGRCAPGTCNFEQKPHARKPCPDHELPAAPTGRRKVRPRRKTRAASKGKRRTPRRRGE